MSSIFQLVSALGVHHLIQQTTSNITFTTHRLDTVGAGILMAPATSITSQLLLLMARIARVITLLTIMPFHRTIAQIGVGLVTIGKGFIVLRMAVNGYTT